MVVSTTGEEESPDPDAEETDVFLVMGADRRARKGERGEEKEAPEAALEAAPEEEGSLLYRGASLFASGAEPSAPATPASGVLPSATVQDTARLPDAGTGASPASADTGPESPARDTAHPGAAPAPAPAASADLGANGFPSIPTAPYTDSEYPSRAELAEETETGLAVGERSGSPVHSGSPATSEGNAPSPSEGIGTWIDAANEGHTPVANGYEHRIAAVKRIPASPWRRAVFAATGGRLNLG